MGIAEFGKKLKNKEINLFALNYLIKSTSRIQRKRPKRAY